MGFILATAGSAIGLGNIWSFPFVMGQNGGGAFLLVYLPALFLIAAPVFAAELAIGRLGQASAPTSFSLLAPTRQRGFWTGVGTVGLVALLLVLSYYSVIAGQVMAYAGYSLLGTFDDASGQDIVNINARYEASPWQMALFTLVFLGACCLVVARGVEAGIERAAGILMPALFVLLILIAAYAGLIGDVGSAYQFLFAPSDVRLSSDLVFAAIGQAFFTLGLGTGSILMYGAYLRDSRGIASASISIILLDLMVAILAGLAIFPLVFAGGLSPAAGPSLIFITLPTVFADLMFGSALAFALFLLLTLAALTTGFAMFAPLTTRLEEKGLSRRRAALVVMAAAATLAPMTILSFNHLRDWYPLAALGFDGKTIFALIREGINNIVLPLSGVLYALFVGYWLQHDRVAQALGRGAKPFFMLWRRLLRYVVPVVIAALFITSL